MRMDRFFVRIQKITLKNLRMLNMELFRLQIP